jgi:hypothetical protein
MKVNMMSNITRYAQGAVSSEYKAILRERIGSARTDEELEVLLNDIHDSTLACRNSPEGLRKAVSFLSEINSGE